MTVILADGSTDQYTNHAPPDTTDGEHSYWITAAGHLTVYQRHPRTGAMTTPKPSKPSTHPPAGSRSPDSNATKNPRMGRLLTPGRWHSASIAPATGVPATNQRRALGGVGRCSMGTRRNAKRQHGGGHDRSTHRRSRP